MKLALNAQSEMAAQDCLGAITRYLPPATLVDPICSCIAETQDDELRNVAYSIAMTIPQSVKAHLNVSFYQFQIQLYSRFSINL